MSDTAVVLPEEVRVQSVVGVAAGGGKDGHGGVAGDEVGESFYVFVRSCANLNV